MTSCFGTLKIKYVHKQTLTGLYFPKNVFYWSKFKSSFCEIFFWWSFDFLLITSSRCFLFQACFFTKLLHQISRPLALGPHTFLRSINASGIKIRSILKKFMMFISWSRKHEIAFSFRGSQGISVLLDSFGFFYFYSILPYLI